MRWNMRVGFEDAQALIAERGVHAGFKAYNGSGAAAERYAIQVSFKADRWHRRFKAAGVA